MQCKYSSEHFRETPSICSIHSHTQSQTRLINLARQQIWMLSIKVLVCICSPMHSHLKVCVQSGSSASGMVRSPRHGYDLNKVIYSNMIKVKLQLHIRTVVH